VVGIYVDDLLIMGECMKEIDQFKGEMKQSFRMSDFGTSVILPWHQGEARSVRHQVVPECVRQEVD
jgi:hypothetical protein